MYFILREDPEIEQIPNKQKRLTTSTNNAFEEVLWQEVHITETTAKFSLHFTEGRGAP